ncbi:MAG: hypothetical protein ACYTFX_05695 [Planctomycetota bacterium]|jgi:hypothetical protein
MRKFIVLLLMVAVLATAAQAVEFTPDADTFVRGTTTDNYGGDDDLEVKLATGILNKNFKSVRARLIFRLPPASTLRWF